MLTIHFEIPPFDCLIRKEYLYDFKSGHEDYEKCHVFSISSYPGFTPTFQLLVNNKFIYSDIPVIGLCWQPAVSLPLNVGNYFNCPSGELTVSVFKSLEGIFQIFNRDQTRRASGEYLMTFDWFQDNENCHLMAQDDGNFCLTPSHKMVMSSQIDEKLPSFKKLHHSWIL